MARKSKKEQDAKAKANADATSASGNNNGAEADGMVKSVPVAGLYKDWFLDYASYVILERAVPHNNDGLKPVQRRILHAMVEMDDGRFHKVANIIGQTMQFHPHGDAAIGDALVKLGQKDLMIDCQGNWGDIRTGDSAAAPRYIEARLTKFALEVAFNPKTTAWQLSYDGRKREPVTLPMKFPMLLAQGVEGIAVGLSTKIMPHNFCELCKGSIKILQGKRTKIEPDFPTGGIADFSEYKRGARGGKIRLRSNIEIVDKKTLAIRDIPYTTTTSGLIDSIVKANDKGKIKVKKVIDNTAADVEILVELAPGASPEVTMDALYAFTYCEVSISPNACVIIDDKPHFLTVDELLRQSTEHTKELLRQELEIRKNELELKWHFSSLEKIFIENRIYRDIEECETWEAVIEAIDKGLDPFKKLLKRKVTEEDIVRLTEIKIKRISKFDSFKADELIKKIEDELKQVKHNLKHLNDFAIAYFERLLEKYGKGRERKTEIKAFDTITARSVVAANAKLYVNRTDGFIGHGMRKDEFVSECSDIDDIIVIRKDGRMLVTRIADKKFVGKGILYAGVWKRGDDRMTYNLIYADVKDGKNYAKRFNLTSVTRDKEYPLGKGEKLKVHYLTANPNGESELVTVNLSAGTKARKKVFDFDFGEIAVKGRASKGNIVSRYAIRKVVQKERGSSTLGGRDIWLDDSVGRLNTENRGNWIGAFDTGDQIVVIYNSGEYELTSSELTNRYEMEKIAYLGKYDPEQVFSIVHYEGSSKNYFVKRFQIEGGVHGRTYPLISESGGSKMVVFSSAEAPEINFTIKKGKSKEKIEVTEQLDEFIDIKGWKAAGNRLTQFTVVGKVKCLTPEPVLEQADASQEMVDDVSEPPTEEAKGEHKIGEEVEWDLESGTKTAKKKAAGAKAKSSSTAKAKKGGKTTSKKSSKSSDKDDKEQGELF